MTAYLYPNPDPGFGTWTLPIEAPRILFIAPGPLQWASTRLRAAWPAEYIPGAQWQEIKREIPDDYDIYVYVKTINPDGISRQIEEGKQVWWDLCDPVHWLDPKNARYMADLSTGIVTSNQALTDDFNIWYGRAKAITIPDRIKLGHYPAIKYHSHANPVRLIWYGAGQNRISLFAAVMPLERLATNGINIELTIMDDRVQQWEFTNSFPVYFVPWQLEREAQIIAAHDIAIVPPYPGPWGAVKSNNKLLTAWACGLPVCDCQDYDYLYELATDSGLRNHEASEGYSRLIRDFDIEQSAKQWKALLEI